MQSECFFAWHDICFSRSMYFDQNNKCKRALAEAIILQTIADLCDARLRNECEEFFRGEGFRICSDIIEMDKQSRTDLICFLEKRGLLGINDALKKRETLLENKENKNHLWVNRSSFLHLLPVQRRLI